MKRLILTDYIDAQMPERQRALVDQHLAGCLECVDFLKRVKITVVDPFVSLERPVPVEDVWTKIKDRIENDHAARVAPQELFLGLFDQLKDFLLGKGGDMRNKIKGLMVVGVLTFILAGAASPSYAGHRDRFRFDLDLSVPMEHHYGGYYSSDYVYVSPPMYQSIMINGVTYYVNNGSYYVYTPYGYQVVAPPITVIPSAPMYVSNPVQVMSTTIPTLNTDDAFTVNIPNDKGGYVAVVIKRSGSGYVGPQGEFYAEFPRVAQLKAMYVK